MKKLYCDSPECKLDSDIAWQDSAEWKRKAVDDIAEILCGSRESMPAPERVDVKKLDMETGTMQLLDKAEVITADLGGVQCEIVQPAEMLENEFEIDSAPQDGASKAELRLYNAAIDALDMLMEGTTVLESNNATEIMDTVLALKNIRMLQFADLIDWNRLAEE